MHARTETFVFEPFRLQPERRLLLANGLPVTLTPRAYDVLEFLVRNRDRIVTRDEIVAHVWRGVTVGENNLSVQMSALRHALAEQAGKKQLIINIPGRGYRFVVEVDLDVEAELCVVLPVVSTENTRLLEQPPAAPSSYGSQRKLFVIATFACIIIAISPEVVRVMSVSPVNIETTSDARLSIAIGSFSAIGDNPRAAVLAAEYRNLVLSNLALFSDLKLFSNPVSRVISHFRLTGTVSVDNGVVKPEISIQQEPYWQHLDSARGYPPNNASGAQHSSAAMQMIANIRPSLFKAEHAMRGHHRLDALDLLIDAHVEAADMENPATLSKAILLARQAVSKDPDLASASAFLALLLADSVQLSVASAGTADAGEALNLIKAVLYRYPVNPIYIGLQAYIQLTLEDELQAEITLKHGLAVASDYYYLQQLEAAMFMMSDRFKLAMPLVQPNLNAPDDDRPAYLLYLATDYGGALTSIDSVLGFTGPSWNSGFTKLFKVSIQMRLHRPADARKTLAEAMPQLAPDFRHVSALRRCYFALPRGTWTLFLQDLQDAGMPS